MVKFFYGVMRGDESFFSVYTQEFELCFSEYLRFTLTDIENMPPFERYGYLEMYKNKMEEISEARNKANHK